eukprot:CAMPEP_0171099750 /NCGR_PEP_ID=MMETSP0766_2-20121228/52485_1 /TAXON_ID=439317 /ORGANISM="Gambierdiscus australes, Strain CAWD 149" /LENGTH=49 /DNA_ID=CAMNT_0011559453 /DNA_START=15 /DNA_END=164 /DNA_ORIENTATION=+
MTAERQPKPEESTLAGLTSHANANARPPRGFTGPPAIYGLQGRWERSCK